MVNLPVFTADNYTEALLNLAPRGRIWDAGPNSSMRAVFAALAPSFARLSARATNLIVDAFPATTYELLPQWELSEGLPDACVITAQTVEQRRAQVVARFVGLGGQSIPFLTAYALNLGYVITIQEFSPFYADRGTADGPLWSEIAGYLWQVTTSALTAQYFQADISAADDALVAWSTNVVACELSALAPAYSTVIYSGSPVPLIAISGTITAHPRKPQAVLHGLV